MSDVRTVSANGLEIAYESFGEPTNPPVLLIMGLGTQMIAWPAEFCQRLADRGHRVVRFDNRDVGLSTHLDSAGEVNPLWPLLGVHEPPYRLTDMAKDAAGLITALGWESAHVVGVSMGGMIAQTLTLLRPDLVRSLTSISSTTGSLLVGKPRPDVLAKLVTGRIATDREGAIANNLAIYRKIRSPGFPDDLHRAGELAGISYDRRYDPVGGRRQFAAILASPNRTTALRRVAVPTTVIHGTADPLVNLSGGLATAAAIPGSRLVTIAGMGHDLPFPIWDQLIEEIDSTIERAREQGVQQSI
ncbi:MAG: alpha/beta fold hydrolase [Actinomycetota bacterium]|nr:alpha/beta fold hydrolase [Actinomycetota bacterium]